MGNQPRTKDFSIKQETAYPIPLAFAIASAFSAAAVHRGWMPPSQSISNAPTLQVLRANLAQQPNTNKLLPPVSEFKQTLQVVQYDAEAPPCAVGSIISKGWHQVPSGAKLLKQSSVQIIGGCDEILLNPDNIDLSNPVSALRFLRFGVFRDPHQFIQAAVEAKHPVMLESGLPCDLKAALKFCTSNPDDLVAKMRLRTLMDWSRRAKNLEQNETDLRRTMPGHVRLILRSKRLCLWRELLVEWNYPDLAVFDEVVHGIH